MMGVREDRRIYAPFAVNLGEYKDPVSRDALCLAAEKKRKRGRHDKPGAILRRQNVTGLVALEAPIRDAVLRQDRLQVAGIVLDSVLAGPKERWKIVDDGGGRIGKHRLCGSDRTCIDSGDC